MKATCFFMNKAKNERFKNDYESSNLEAVDFGDFKMLMTERFKKYYSPGKFEKLTVDLFLDFIGEDSKVMDIGAHYGYYTLVASQKIKSGKIQALEPVAENFEILKKNIEINGIKNVEIHQLAASNETGEKILNVTEASDSSGFYEHPLVEILDRRKIKTVKLDDVFDGDKIDVIKMDTEGHEMQVLEGMEEIIRKSPDIKMFIEFNPSCLSNAKTDPTAFLEKISSLGFEIYFLDDNKEKIYFVKKRNLNKWNKIMDKSTHINILCAKSGSFFVKKILDSSKYRNKLADNVNSFFLRISEYGEKIMPATRIFSATKKKFKKITEKFGSDTNFKNNEVCNMDKKTNRAEYFSGNLNGLELSHKVAIVIPTFNQEDFTIRCFGSIEQNTKDYFIIWIDNGSDRNSKEKVKKFLDKNNITYELIQNQENLGFVKATNQGIKRAMELGADYVVLQNNDTEVYEGWLEKMIRVAESDPKIGMVGPLASPCNSWQSIDHIGKILEEFCDLPKYNNNPEEYSRLIGRKYEKQFSEVKNQLAFFCTLIKAEVVRSVGLLSEDFGIGFGDDDDYSIRAIKKGWKIYIAKDVFIFHNHRTTFKSIYTRGEINIMQKKNADIFKNKHQTYLANQKTGEKEFHEYIADNYLEKDDLVLDFKTGNKKEYKDIRLLLKSNNSKKRILLSVRHCFVRSAIRDFLKIAKSENYDLYIIDDSKREICKITPREDLWILLLKKMKFLNLLLIKKEHSSFVGFVSHSFKKGGSERSLVDMIDGLIKRKILCHVYIPAAGDLEEKIKKRPVSYTVIQYPWWAKSISTNIPEEKTREAITKARKTLLKNMVVINPDVVYTNSSVVNVGAIAAKRLSKPHIWHIREFGSKKHGLEFYQGFEKAAQFIYENSDKVLFNSQALKKHYEDFIKRDKSEVVYNYIDENNLLVTRKEELRYFKKKESLKMIMMGGVVRGKGQKDAVLAIKSLVENGIKNVELLIAGGVEPVYHKELCVIIEDNKLENYVKFSGYLDSPFEAVSESDLMVMCSQDEAFGRVTAEAILMKKPVIGARSGGTPELIQEGISGFLYEPENYEELAEKIKYFLEHKEKLEEFGLSGYNFATGKFNEEQYSGRVSRIIKELKERKKEEKNNLLTIQLIENFLKSRKKNQIIDPAWKKILRIKDLLRKALNVFFDDGPSTFFSYAWKFIKYGRNYFR